MRKPTKRGNRIILDVTIGAAGWEKEIADPVPLLRQATRRAVAASGSRAARGGRTVAVNVALLDDRGIRKLNRQYRGKDKPTNVLSFAAAGDDLPPPARGKSSRSLQLGDIAIALGTVRREAKAQGKSVKNHLAHLMVHAVLHLLGYDHEDDAEAERMENVERRTLAAMGIADPYQSPSQSTSDRT
jgi:probable rRNA maturation factor